MDGKYQGERPGARPHHACPMWFVLPPPQPGRKASAKKAIWDRKPRGKVEGGTKAARLKGEEVYMGEKVYQALMAARIPETR